MTFHDRWIAAQNAEDEARREQASALLSGVALIMVFACAFVWIGVLSGRF